MCLRAELGARIADKTVLKMMRELGIRCGIRRETDYHRYNSYRGPVGERFDNLIARDFRAGAPWEKLGTDVTEFRQPWGKAYFAPVYDFCTKEIVSWSVSTSPDMAHPAGGGAQAPVREDAGRGLADRPQRHGLAVPAP